MKNKMDSGLILVMFNARRYKLGVATPAEPRGEKKTFFRANFGR